MKMMNRATLIAGLTLVFAAAAFADEVAPPPDYSRQALLRIVRDMPEREERTISFDRFGEVELRTRFVRAHVLYSPVPPLQGSMPRVTLEWPNPFVQTGTDIAMTPQTWSRQ
jgi:hypothetical protein